MRWSRSGGRAGKREKEEILYGINPILESLKSGRRRFHKLVVASGKEGPRLTSLLELALDKGIPLERVDAGELNRLAPGSKHQGVAALVEPIQPLTLDELLAAAPARPGTALIMLDGVEDPVNLGSIIRSAEVMGFSGVLIPGSRSVGVTPTVVSVSAGAAEHLPVARVGNAANALERLKREGFWIVGAVLRGGTPSHRFRCEEPLVLVVGSEGRGIRRLVREKCDLTVSIPMRGKVDSLNVAVASAIMMYDIARGWRDEGSL